MHRVQHDYERLRNTFDGLARRVSGALHDSLLALRRSDALGAAQIVKDDADINALQQDVEEQATRLLAQWQLMLRDLRRVVAILMVASELERIGDYAKQIAAHVTQARAVNYALPALAELQRLGALTEQILAASIAAFTAEDVSAARGIAPLDDQIDVLRHAIGAAVRGTPLNDAAAFDAGLATIEIARTLERVADRATNIAERTIYLATATHESLNP